MHSGKKQLQRGCCRLYYPARSPSLKPTTSTFPHPIHSCLASRIQPRVLSMRGCLPPSPLFFLSVLAYPLESAQEKKFCSVWLLVLVSLQPFFGCVCLPSPPLPRSPWFLENESYLDCDLKAIRARNSKLRSCCRRRYLFIRPVTHVMERNFWRGATSCKIQIFMR